jgi:carboxypeptidase Q
VQLWHALTMLPRMLRALWLSVFLMGPASDGRAAPPPRSLAAAYKGAAARIVEAALADEGAWKKLAHLCDRIGNRPSGSPAMARAISWARATLAADGHEGVRTEEVKVPVWERGEEEAVLVRPVERRLALLGLGGTVGTPPEGVEADVVVAPSFEALEALGDRARGKIVLYTHRLEPVGPGQTPSYRTAYPFRAEGATRAARRGAVASLVRSLATASLRSPHTGTMDYGAGVAKIPAAALATEDADLVERLAASGERVTVKLRLGARSRPDATEANVVGELRGRERPEEVVVIGAHLDSWDVGQGAHDDGAGVVSAMQALTVLRGLHLVPRRTIRVVLFANEEHGGRGGAGYAERHKSEIPQHVAALEADSGGGRPLGVGLAPHKAAGAGTKAEGVGADVLRALATLLAPVGADRTQSGGSGGADVRLLGEAGVPIVVYESDQSRYFDYHHSQADTLDKVDRDDLRKNVAALAVTAYVLADMPGTIER